MLIVIYLIVLVVAAYIRFWTESGVWQAVHTGRTFMLQAATTSVGLGLSHFEFVDRSHILRPLIRLPIPPEGEKALTARLSGFLANPEYIFIFGIIFLLVYIATGFPEQWFLEKIANPAHPRKYVSDVNQEPTTFYKVFIVFNLWLGMVCLLGAWYFLIASTSNDWGWYVQNIVIPAHAILICIFGIGFLITSERGTSGKPQNWDTEGNPPIEKPKESRSNDGRRNQKS
jgi:hypothetical protein